MKHVSKAYLEEAFDEMWEQKLKTITPQSLSSLASRADGMPKGARTIVCVFKDEHGYDLAITYRHVTSSGEPLCVRPHNPTGLLIDGDWCYILPTDPPQG